ncbi:protein BZR1 homolog 2-like [Olea europaea var. sylvestris]|uniref:Protein BZR1 homolog n=1 Tax=Olea europaea subsp. europaea TaxID=158383 RepID=A0A8S0VLK2_OLEEU|nr:protein BZR1 homolog 2-like [Olea europaea var. sylvestris]CAA3032421.1 Hypothetical predicted protein [Olea europaea subsp. europaea]
MKESCLERENTGNDNVRSEDEKKWTKMREKQRRSIATKIFQGLRRHGGYRLSPRADNNQVLRHLAQEAGWIVEPDGTTYRSATNTTTISSGINVCPLCARGRKRAMPVPTSSFKGANAGIGAVTNDDGSECLTVASPCHIGPTTLHHSSFSLPFCGGFSSSSTTIAATASSSSCPSHCTEAVRAAFTCGSLHRPSTYDATTSSQDTPVGWPQSLT